jgi:hypothetical protein
LGARASRVLALARAFGQRSFLFSVVGEVVQLQGDRRKDAAEFLVKYNIVERELIKARSALIHSAPFAHFTFSTIRSFYALLFPCRSTVPKALMLLCCGGWM